MQCRLQKTLAVIVLACLVAVFRLYADETPTKVTAQNRTGDLPFSASLGTDIEHVDIAGGHLVIRIPIYSNPGRGQDFDYHLNYNSKYRVQSGRHDPDGIPYYEWVVED